MESKQPFKNMDLYHLRKPCSYNQGISAKMNEIFSEFIRFFTITIQYLSASLEQIIYRSIISDLISAKAEFKIPLVLFSEFRWCEDPKSAA
jgi:hypothetical protein